MRVEHLFLNTRYQPHPVARIALLQVHTSQSIRLPLLALTYQLGHGHNHGTADAYERTLRYRLVRSRMVPE